MKRHILVLAIVLFFGMSKSRAQKINSFWAVSASTFYLIFPVLHAEDDEPDIYLETIKCIREELLMRFTDTEDPLLHERRLRLRALFGQIPNTRAQEFYDRLGEEKTEDELSKLFHHKLHTTTRNELLQILKDKIRNNEEEEEPKEFPSIWPEEPLPDVMESRFTTALNSLEKAVLASDGNLNQERFLCWIKKLRDPKVDDRVIRWSTICHRETQAALPMAPNCPPALKVVTESDMFKHIGSKEDVESANDVLHFIVHMKSEIVFAYEMTSMAPENFEVLHSDLQRNLQVLEFMTTKPLGGGSAAPKYYVAIKSWLRGQQDNPNSIYSCF